MNQHILQLSESIGKNKYYRVKAKTLKYGLLLLLFGCIAGCNDYPEKDIPKSIYVNRQSLDLFVGESVQLIASPTEVTYQYSWLSEDPEVATVTSNGLVEVLTEGFTNIVVNGGGITAEVPLTAVVRIPLSDVTLSETFLEMPPGDSKTITVTYIPADANDLPKYTWYSENTDVATVNLSGKVTVISKGVTNIVYRIGDIEKKIELDSRVPQRLDRTGWTIVDFSTEEATGEGAGQGVATCVLDGNTSTFWHSQWSGTSGQLPHHITIDMQKELTVSGVDIQRRSGNSDAYRGNIYISSDNALFTKVGSFELADVNDAQTFQLTSVNGRYLKIEITESRRAPYASLAEVYAIGLE